MQKKLNIDEQLEKAYLAMANDDMREQEALEWIEGVLYV